MRVTQFGLVLVKLLVMSFVLHLAVFYLRLGLFLLIIWIAGVWLAILLTRSFWKTFEPAPVGWVVVGTAYVISLVLVWNIFLDRKSLRTYVMTWEDRGAGNEFKQPEIVLTFSEYPAHHIGIYSQQVSEYLRTLASRSVPVTFTVTKDFGCIRGFHESRIGELDRWNSPFGYAGQAGNDLTRNPWPSPFWCP